MASIPKIRFGTDGWRGIIDVEVTNKTVAEAAQAFSEYLQQNNRSKEHLKAVIGYDGRLHSKPFATLFARVLSGNNIIALLSDKTVPTPFLSWYVKDNNLDAGVMITASHNPPEYNGVKFKNYFGAPFIPEETSKVEGMLGKELVQADDEKIYQIDIGSPYLMQIEKYIDFESIKKADLNILIDSMSGAGQQIIENLFFKHNISSKTIFKLAEKNFSGRIAEPVEKNLLPLKEELLAGEYSFGIATDGDADRAGFMMDNGEWLSSQETILLLADYIVNRKKIAGHIVKSISVTDKLRHFFETTERKVIDVQVGFKFIADKMINENIAFGCEESGGYGFKNHIPDRDGILAAFLFSEMVASSGFKKLSGYVQVKREEFGKIYFNRSDNIRNHNTDELFNDLFSNPFENIRGFRVNSFHEYYNSNNIINGLKYTLEGGNRWLLIRNSETEPVVRIYAEGESVREVDDLISAAKEILS
jgi:phosphomannomutase